MTKIAEVQNLLQFRLDTAETIREIGSKIERPTLKNILFAVCLEANYWTQAEATFRQLIKSCFDVNESSSPAICWKLKSPLPLTPSSPEGT
jgi:hypothetical protein